jgi:hypothetical protein
MAVRIENLANNQVVVHGSTTSTFTSYGTLIAVNDFEAGKTYLTDAWDYSATTTRYLAQFLGLPGKGAKAEIEKRLADGRYVLDPAPIVKL